MKPNWIVFITSLMLMLMAASSEIIAQDSYQVGISEIRKANATKARLDSAKAEGMLVLMTLKSYKDSVKFYRDSTQLWKQAAQLQTRRKNRWRKAALISGGIVIAENTIIGLLLKQ